MALKIVYTKVANNDLNEIYEFIKRDSIFYARKEISEIRYAISNLKKNSLSYKIFEDLDNELIREFVFKNYRIIYHIASDIQIEIITIHHHARSISRNRAFNDDD